MSTAQGDQRSNTPAPAPAHTPSKIPRRRVRVSLLSFPFSGGVLMSRGSAAWPTRLTVSEAAAYVTANFYTISETALRSKISRGDLGEAVVRDGGAVRLDRERLAALLSVKFRGLGNVK